MRLCPWSLALASSIPVLGLERFCPRKGCPWPWPWPRIFFVSLALALASSLVSSTPPLLTRKEIAQKLQFRQIKKHFTYDIYLPKRSQLNTKQQLPFGKQTCSRPTVLNLQISFFFHSCEVALTSHICFPIRLVFHQHLNSHIAYPGIPPEPSNHTRGQFLHLPSYPLLRLF